MIDLALRVRDLGHRWLRRASSREEVEQLILLEQYLSALPTDLQTWLWERKPNSIPDDCVPLGPRLPGCPRS